MQLKYPQFLKRVRLPRLSDLRLLAVRASRAWRLWVVVLVVLLCALALGYAWWSSQDRGDLTEGSVSMTSLYREVPPGLYEYRSKSYHFSVLFPQELKVLEYGGKGDSLTVTFGEGVAQGFQIFATPYNLARVTAERFAKDNPSGVFVEPVEAIVAGVPATLFFGLTVGLGETREVWFIRKGILYEVNARRQDDEWLGRIMQTWMFVD